MVIYKKSIEKAKTAGLLIHTAQWKVRRTLAFSIHELAVILGDEIAQSDLVPVFNGFIKDLDEVRIGVLKHLAHFLRLLRPHHRRDYLPRMDEFLRTDNEKNWRFRLELATQLVGIVDLFSPQDCQTFLAPIALALMADKVVHIRHTCFTVVSIIHIYVHCPKSVHGKLSHIYVFEYIYMYTTDPVVYFV